MSQRNELIELWLKYKVDLRVSERELYGRRIECFIKELGEERT